jgi:hypothetical protein
MGDRVGHHYKLCSSWMPRPSVVCSMGWMQGEANITIKVQNDNLKKMRDEIISQGGEKHWDMIYNIIRSTLAIMTVDSRQ